MTTDDLDDICRIEKESFRNPWPKDMLQDAVQSKWTYCPAAKDSAGNLVGYACLIIHDTLAHLTNIAVSKELRHQGIGKMLMNNLVGKADDFGCTEMILDVRPSNHEAISLYNEYGFTELYRRESYYSNPSEDAVVMGLSLGKRNCSG